MEARDAQRSHCGLDTSAGNIDGFVVQSGLRDLGRRQAQFQHRLEYRVVFLSFLGRGMQDPGDLVL